MHGITNKSPLNSSFPLNSEYSEYTPLNCSWLISSSLTQWKVFDHRGSKSTPSETIYFNSAISEEISLKDNACFVLRNDLKKSYEFMMNQNLVNKSYRLTDIHRDIISLIKFTNESHFDTKRPTIISLSQITQADILSYLDTYTIDEAIVHEVLHRIEKFNGPVPISHWNEMANELKLSSHQITILRYRIQASKNTDIYNSQNSIKKEFCDLNVNLNTEELHKASAKTLLNKVANLRLFYDSSVVQTSPICFSPDECLEVALANAKLKDVTKTKVPPLSTVFHLISSAINYAHTYGAALRSYLVKLDMEMASLTEESKLNSKQFSDEYIKDLAFQRVQQPLELKPLKINSFGSTKESEENKANYFRGGMNISTAIQLYFSSFAILSEAYLASRKTSIKQLKRNCLRINPLDGKTDIVYRYQKTRNSPVSIEISRPIPEKIYLIGLEVAELSEYLESRLGLSFDCNDSFLLSVALIKKAFYRKDPCLNKETPEGVEDDYIQTLLNMFTDWCQVPTIEDKRWYISTHQLRRLFAILYFNMTDETGIEELSWLLGHDGLETTFGYAELDDGDIWLDEAISCISQYASNFNENVVLSKELQNTIASENHVELNVNLQLESQIYQAINDRIAKTGEKLHFRKMDGNKVYFYFQEDVHE